MIFAVDTTAGAAALEGRAGHGVDISGVSVYSADKTPHAMQRLTEYVWYWRNNPMELKSPGFTSCLLVQRLLKPEK